MVMKRFSGQTKVYLYQIRGPLGLKGLSKAHPGGKKKKKKLIQDNQPFDGYLH